MTNREWLSKMGDEDFVNWIYAERTRAYDFDERKAEVIAPNYSPSLSEIIAGWTDARLRLLGWLKEERE